MAERSGDGKRFGKRRDERERERERVKRERSGGGEERCLCARWWAVRRICRPGVRNRDIEFTPFLFWRIAACDTIRRGFISGRPRGSDFFILTNSLLRFIGFQRDIRRREIKRARALSLSLSPPPPRCRQSESKAKSLKDIHRFTVPFRIARLEGLFYLAILRFSLFFFKPRYLKESGGRITIRSTFDFSSLFLSLVSSLRLIYHLLDLDRETRV